jgi:hypothetical protein
MPAQLTLAQRAILGELLKQNCPKREIACRLGVHRSTVDRELKRNTGPIRYLDQLGRAALELASLPGGRCRFPPHSPSGGEANAGSNISDSADTTKTCQNDG